VCGARACSLCSLTNLHDNINLKENIITDGSLTIARTDGLLTALNSKQATLTSNIDITTGRIGSGNITGRTNTTITAPTIIASSNLLYGTSNVGTKITELETALNGKQAILNSNVDITT
jgi:hypothetical protein